MKTISLFMICLVSLLPLAAQAPQPKRPCDLEQGQQFDFWVGKWVLTWTDAQGKEQRGVNHIRKVLDSCIVEESFDGGSFKGRSYSVYNPQSKEWQQTWVDNQGGYLLFTGTFENGEMTLVGQPRKNPKGQMVLSRMVFKEIQKDSLIWHWQSSLDNGKQWKDMWVIRYQRDTKG